MVSCVWTGLCERLLRGYCMKWWVWEVMMVDGGNGRKKMESSKENLMEEIEMRKKEMKKTIAANSTQER